MQILLGLALQLFPCGIKDYGCGSMPEHFSFVYTLWSVTVLGLPFASPPPPPPPSLFHLCKQAACPPHQTGILQRLPPSPPLRAPPLAQPSPHLPPSSLQSRRSSCWPSQLSLCQCHCCRTDDMTNQVHFHLFALPIPLPLKPHLHLNCTDWLPSLTTA